MVDLIAAGSRFDTVYRTVFGVIVIGRLIGVREANPSNVVPIHRLFRTFSSAGATSGNIIIAPDDTKHLLSDAPVYFLQGGSMVRTFVATLMDKTMNVKRAQVLTDAVTGLSVRGLMQTLSTIYAFFEPGLLKFDKTTHVAMPHQSSKVYTNYLLNTNDVLDDTYTVTKVDVIAGITVAEVTT